MSQRVKMQQTVVVPAEPAAGLQGATITYHQGYEFVVDPATAAAWADHGQAILLNSDGTPVPPPAPPTEEAAAAPAEEPAHVGQEDANVSH